MIRYFFSFLLLSLCSTTIFAQTNSQQALRKLNTFVRYIEMAYVDSVNSDKIVEDAIKAILKELDPHSVYIPADELRRKNEPLVGNFEGVGIQFNLLHDTLLVISPISGGPSEKLGIHSGDKIIKIDGKLVAGIGFTNQDVVDHLRGKKGTKVTVSILRAKNKELLDFTITRDKIPIYSVDAVYMANKNTGYIKLNRFAATSMGEIYEGMDKLHNKGMKNLILDLRGNSGGYLKTAIELADQFLEQDRLIVYTEGKAYPRDNTFSTSVGRFEKGKLVILIDEGSASASEIVAGAVQDWDRGLIIGRRSFGKGLVQRPYGLPDGSAMRLTISRYFTPSGRSIQRPYEKGVEAYYEDIYTRFKNGELMHQDSIHFPDSLKYETKVNQRTVYGGGGIMPDIFIPIDTSETSDYWSALIRKGILNRFSLDYLDLNRERIASSYKSAQEFKDEFDVTENIFDDLIQYAEQNDLPKSFKQIERSKKLIQINLKALIARGVWNSTAFYSIVNTNDDAIKAALEAIEGDTFKKEKLNYK